MKKIISSIFILVTLVFAPGATAQTLTTLYSFIQSSTNGFYPHGPLVLNNGILYGTTVYGGPQQSDPGTIFAINTDGTGFTNLHLFSALSSVENTNSDGAQPYSGLTVSGDLLYGTGRIGGAGGTGTVFKLRFDGSDFTILHTFPPAYRTNTDSYGETNGEGAAPNYGSLVVSGNTLYGTTYNGGLGGSGTVYGVNTDGTGFTNIYNFSAESAYTFLNTDGCEPVGVVLSENVLYGAANNGGLYGGGTIFKVNPDGTGFTVLHEFTNADGFFPNSVIVSGNLIYGTASNGGNAGNGTVFSLNIDGSEFTVLHNFAPEFESGIGNSDGRAPTGGLILSGNTLYGSTLVGGYTNAGTLFSLNTDGTGFTTLHMFVWNDGSEITSALTLCGNQLFGVASDSGPSRGTVFSLNCGPSLSLMPAGGNIVLSWPTNASGFDYSGYTLQSSPSMTAPSWSSMTTPSNISNGQFAVTNAMPATQMFYRLVH